MATKQQWESATSKLLQMTNDGTIEWRENERIRRSDAVGPAYTTIALGRVIEVYEFEYPYYDSDSDSTVPMKDVAIKFVKATGELEYRWPKSGHHFSLLDAVRFNVTNVQGFLDDFLGAGPAGLTQQPTHS